MKILHSLPVLLVSLLPLLNANAQNQNSRQPLQELPDEWDEASWSPPDQDSTGLPGDNFSLQGALALFKKASSPEEFEKLLNTEENKVNNLDLNGDGNIDYLRVINKKQNNVQLFVIQALVSNTESQDIAVIELEKTGENSAVIQIAGDEDIYGVTTLAEPAETDSLYSAEDHAFNYNTYTRPHGPAADEYIPAFAPAHMVVNVWFWPCVRRVYAPAYVVWTSPWSWVNPPVWWRPWRPMPVYAYRPACHHYSYGYVYAPVRRIPPARVMYRPIRTYSGYVYERNRVVVTNYRTTRADRGHMPGRYEGGRYNTSNRNSFYSGGNNYNGYRNNSPDRNNYGSGSSRPAIQPASPGRLDRDIRGQRPQPSGSYGNGSPGNNYQPSRPSGSAGSRPPTGTQGRPQSSGRPSGNYQAPPRNNSQPGGSYQGTPGRNSQQGGRTSNPANNGRAGRTRGI